MPPPLSLQAGSCPPGGRVSPKMERFWRISPERWLPRLLSRALLSPPAAGTGPRASPGPARWGRGGTGRTAVPHSRRGPAPRSARRSGRTGGVGGAGRGGISSLTQGGPRQCQEGRAGAEAPGAARSPREHSLYGHREPLSDKSPPRRTSPPRAPHASAPAPPPPP